MGHFGSCIVEVRRTIDVRELRNDALSPLFQAVIEATEEAIINALLMADSMTGFKGKKADRLDHDQLKKILKKYGRSN